MSQFCNMRSVFKPLVTYFRKILEKLRKFSLRTPEIKKKISLKHPRIKKKNKKKIGSNAKNLRNLEPWLSYVDIDKNPALCIKVKSWFYLIIP